MRACLAAGRGIKVIPPWRKPGAGSQSRGRSLCMALEGSLRVFHYTNALFINNGDGPQQVALTGRPAFGHFATQLEDCAAVIAADGTPSITGEDGIRALAAMLQVYS